MAAEDLEAGRRRPAREGAVDEVLLGAADGLRPDGILEPEHEPGADGLDDGGGAALLALLGIVKVDVVLGVDVGHGAAAGHGRDGVGQQGPADDEHARRPRAADELVRGDEERVLVVEIGAAGVAIVGGSPGCHVEIDVGRGRAIVPEREGAMLVEQGRDAAGVRLDAGDVGGGGERADLQRPAGVGPQLVGEVGQVDATVGVLVDGHDIGDRLAPGQLVGVVLVGADEDDRSLVGGDVTRQAVARIEVSRDAQVEDADELVHRGRRARTAEDDGVLVAVGAAGLADDVAGVLAEAGRLQARCHSTPCGCWRRAA